MPRPLPSRPARAVTLDRAALRGRPLPMPRPGGDKEDRGRVLVIGGSVENPGAAVLAGLGALRAGAGKLQIATVESVARTMAVAFPEARVFGLPESAGGGLAPEAAEALAARIRDCAAVVLGPGMMDPPAVEELTARLAGVFGADRGPGLVLDAAPLKCLLTHADRLAARSDPAVLTPHAGEMASCLGRPLQAVEADPWAAAEEAARRLNAVVALKGAATVIAGPDGAAFVNEHGSPGLATSGSGDVLAGVIGGLLARGASAPDAAAWGVWLHAEAGARLERRLGRLGFLARELPAELPPIMAELTES